jgi:hypothetical protein
VNKLRGKTLAFGYLHGHLRSRVILFCRPMREDGGAPASVLTSQFGCHGARGEICLNKRQKSFFREKISL